MSRSPLLAIAIAVAVVLAATSPPASAQSPGGGTCLASGPLPAARAATDLRFGITPQLAGSAGPVQQPSAPEDPAKVLAALGALRVDGRALVVRLNRMFWSDGRAGIDRYLALVDRYAAAGLQVELQVRYHPPEGHDGDIDGWVAYVREAARAFATRRAVVELSITNEANLPVSPNTSDGTYMRVHDAIVRGVTAAREELDAAGRPDISLGFTYAYRFTPQADDAFFTGIGARATPEFLKALDHVGLQLYPGLFYPPVSTDVAADTVEAIGLLRTCLMGKAKLGPAVRIWITENGYASRLGLGTEQQAADLTSTIDAVARVSGTLGVSDYRYFNLRDNVSTGADLFDSVGLLFDDYRPKPAFAAYRTEIARVGARAPVASSRLSASVAPRRVVRGRLTRLTVRVSRDGVGIGGAVVRLGAGTAHTGPDGTARLRVRFTGRPGLRRVRVADGVGVGAGAGSRATVRLRVLAARARHAARR